MQKRLIWVLGFLFTASVARSQITENLKLGLYGRSEQNIYRYYGGLGLGNFYTQRTSSGYSAGIVAHASLNYLFNAGMSFGISDATYHPDFKYNDLQNTLWNLHIRLWEYNFWGELKLGQNENRGARLIAGAELTGIQYKREIWQFEQYEKHSWPSARCMPRLGLGYELPLKKQWTLHPNMGMRLALTNPNGYDFFFNQFWIGMSVMHKIKVR